MSLLKNITGNKKRNPKILAFSISLAGICLLSFFILASTAMATQPGQEHEKRVALQGSAHPPLPGMHIKGAVDPNKRIDVYVNLRYPPGCPPLPITREDFAKKLHDRKNLTHEEFLSCYGALEEDIAKVKKFARKNGLHVKAVDAAHRIVTLNGTLEALGRAFSVYLVIYSTPDFTFRGHNGPVFLPESLVPCVTGVHGLDNRPIVRPNLRILTAQDQTATTPVTSYKPQEVAKLYDFPQGLDGKGQSIAIIELSGGYNPDCLKKYFEDILGGVMPNITSVSVNNGANKPGVSQNSDNEVQLDIEVLGAIAPGADLYVYFTSAPTAAEFLKAVKQAVHNAEYQHTIISISWGMPECYLDKTILNSFNETFQEAAAKGITVLAATGDAGSYDQTADGLAHINFPSSASFVTSCGGTKLAASNGQSRDEIVWNEGALGGGATGGGVSPYFSVPSYQTDAGLRPASVNPGNKTGRGLPDVCANADTKTGYIVSVNCKSKVVGGTSAAAPLWAALTALYNQELGTRIGFLNPILYHLGRSDDVFNDIRKGNNSLNGVKGYSAAKGWDACTGWGSPKGKALLQAIKKNYTSK